jgi:hypothetical protein
MEQFTVTCARRFLASRYSAVEIYRVFIFFIKFTHLIAAFLYSSAFLYSFAARFHILACAYGRPPCTVAVRLQRGALCGAWNCPGW